MSGRPDRQVAIVTGIDGFLGRHLANHLLDIGHQVIGLSRQVEGWTDPRLSRAAVNLADPDVTEAVVRRALRQFTANGDATVYHTAGMADAKQCELRPIEAFQANVSTTVSALMMAGRLELPKFVCLSTGLVYIGNHDDPITESQSTGADSIYTATKLAAEALVEGFVARYRIGAAILRLGNVFGARMTQSSVVGRLLHQASRQETLTIRSGAPTRDFLYVRDATEGMVAAAGGLGGGHVVVYNLSSGIGYTVGDLARTLAHVVKPSLNVVETSPEDVGTHPRMVLSNARLTNATGWRPRRSLAEGLAASLLELPALAS